MVSGGLFADENTVAWGPDSGALSTICFPEVCGTVGPSLGLMAGVLHLALPVPCWHAGTFLHILVCHSRALSLPEWPVQSGE